jgi:PadR family transcriptional regulator, phenolic acid-responsive transcriptional regulator
MRTSRAARPRTGTLTTTEFAVLTVLTLETQRRALSGYDLLRIVERSVGYLWKPTKSHLYAVLPRLVERGLASRKTAPGEKGPERQLYRVTKKGDRLARAWLEEPVTNDPELFRLKAFYGGLQSREALVAHYRRYAEELRAHLAELRAIPNNRQGHNYFHYFLLSYGIERARFEIRWAEEAASELDS